MSNSNPLDREEYIEQAYFFRNLRERIAENRPAQEILTSLDQEILATTRLPMAIQFLSTELKHTGLLSSGFARLPHYFAPFQSFVIQGTEHASGRFSIETALLVLEREALYRSQQVSRPGLFVYQFEVICRNRLGYDGLASMAADPLYDDDWKAFLVDLRAQVGLIDLSDLIYLRSELYLQEQLRRKPDYESPLPPLFAEKEGKIAKANRQRDPLYFFAALQDRQLNYPEVPRPKPRDDAAYWVETLQAKFREMEGRMRLLEAELRGRFEDVKELGQPDLLRDEPEIDIS